MTKLVIAVLISLISSSALATLPEVEWTPEARITLARAVVAEADWSTRDHAAIAWVLKRRWEQRQKVQPQWTFLDQVNAYCAGMKSDTERSRWFRDLPEDPYGAPPDHWPYKRAWNTYQADWARVLRLVDAWQRGAVRDPCRGRAMHWGSSEDSERPAAGKWSLVQCGATLNLFWQTPLPRPTAR